MIRVGFDCSAVDPTFKSHAQRGIGRYVSRLISAFECCHSSEVNLSYFDHQSLSRNGVADRVISAIPRGRTHLRQHLLHPSRLNEGALKDCSLLHYPAHMDAPAWTSKPYVLTVLDLIPHLLSELYRANKPSWRFRAARMLEVQAIRNATILLAISEATARDIVRVLNVPREKIVVTPLGVDSSFLDVQLLRRSKSVEWSAQLRGRLGIPTSRPIILYVGGHDERKNVGVIIEITKRAIDAAVGIGLEPPVLVLAGRVSAAAEQARLDSSLARFSMSRDTISLGYVSEADLQALYAESALFLFPTLYEGFGLPALEAMAGGLPVVSSNTSSLPEVVGEAGVLFDPNDVDAGVRGVLSILNEPDVSGFLSQAGPARAALFTWERTAKLTEQAYLQADLLLKEKLSGGQVKQEDRVRESQAGG